MSCHGSVIERTPAIDVLYERAPLTAAELSRHPEFDQVVWDLKPAKKGKVTVAEGRWGGPININYEIHGNGPVLLVVRFRLLLFLISLNT